jgi:four helix bundle protein
VATVSRFEDLAVWKKARVFNREVHLMTRGRGFGRDFAMVDQFRRASLSVMNNFAEGLERCRRNEFLRFLSLARGSAGEARSKLYAARDVDDIDEQTFSTMVAQAEGLGRAAGSFRLGLERSIPQPLNGKSRPAAR